jgi:hypothetical protein
MRRTRIVDIEGREVTVSELTVEQVTRLYQDDTGIQALAGAVLGEPAATLRLLAWCTGLAEEELRDLAAGANAYARLATALVEVNEDFFAMLPGALTRLGQTLRGESPSPTPPAGSSSGGTGT